MSSEGIEIQIIDAFCEEAFCGNPAGVVLAGAGLSEPAMQAIAREINASETAFLVDETDGQYQVRYFTPTQEVDFCGHASVALASALAWTDRVVLGEEGAQIQFEVAAGQIPIELRSHQVCGVEVVMTQTQPLFADFGYKMELLAGALGLDPYLIPPSWPLGLAHTGLWALVVPVATTAAVDQARPDFAALSDLNKKIGCVSTHLYTHAGPNNLYCRGFSPAVGVSEDPFTGSATGATAALLVREGAIELSPPTARLTFEQGHSLGRLGYARVEVDHGHSGPERVRVAGTAVPVFQGTIRHP